MTGEKEKALQEAFTTITLQSFPQPWEGSVLILIFQAGKLRLKLNNLPKVVSFQRMRIKFQSTSMGFPAPFFALLHKGKPALGKKIRGRRQ